MGTQTTDQFVPFDFAPFGGAVVADPFPVYDSMRATGRFLRTPWGATVVHRYEDVRALHADHDGFSMTALGPGAMMMGGDDGPFGGRTMLTTDPPEHEQLRRVVNRAFTPRSIAALEPRIREVCREYLAPLRGGEPFDLVARFAAPLPTIVIAELLGIPADDRDRFRAWTDVVTGTGSRQVFDPAERRRNVEELSAYLRDQIDRRQHVPSDDLIGRMIAANDDGVMTDEEVVASCVLLLIAGNETTMRLITNMALNLTRNPDQLELLVEDPTVIPAGVEETLRFEGPVQLMFRGARSGATLGGAEVSEGSLVLTVLGAANRDPDAFADAHRFDVTRSDNHHISFGHGVHFCLGASLARLETRVAFEELLADTPRFALVGSEEDLRYPDMLLLRSPKELVLRAA